MVLTDTVLGLMSPTMVEDLLVSSLENQADWGS